VSVFLNDCGTVSIAPEMTAAKVACIEIFSIFRLKLAHELRQIRVVRDTNKHMEMVAKTSEGIEHNAIFHEHVLQYSAEHLTILFGA
jgi:hypothetical protein